MPRGTLNDEAADLQERIRDRGDADTPRNGFSLRIDWLHVTVADGDDAR